jgi:multiple sugar transport system substrate-binding protein
LVRRPRRRHRRARDRRPAGDRRRLQRLAERHPLVLEIVENTQAYDILATQIAAGNAPDIVGPVGIRGRADFPGVWLDLSDLIAAADYDLSDFDPALVEFYKIEGQGQIGLPFAVFPSYITYNKALFDEAGLAYPPSRYGEPVRDGRRRRAAVEPRHAA